MGKIRKADSNSLCVFYKGELIIKSKEFSYMADTGKVVLEIKTPIGKLVKYLVERK